MDEPDEDEDARTSVDGLPFVAEKDFLTKYGTAFSLSFNDSREVVLSPLNPEND